jgi:ribonuclease Z
MELIFLGTSSALPTKDRNHSAVALKAFGEIILWIVEKEHSVK